MALFTSDQNLSAPFLGRKINELRNAVAHIRKFPLNVKDSVTDTFEEGHQCCSEV